MEDEFQADIIEGLDENRASRLLQDMDPDDAADIVGDLPYEKAETLLRLMGVEDAAEIRKLLGYKEDTAGGLMTTQFVAMHTTDTVQETTEVLRGLDEDHPTVNYVYVLDEYDKLVGVLSLRTLVLAKDDTPLESIMFDELITSLPEESEDEVAADISKYDLMAMPVVNEQGLMLGIVTVDDAMEVIEDNVEEGRTRWAWGQFAIMLAVFVVLLVPYTFTILHFFGNN
jgi:magnesium transporter